MIQAPARLQCVRRAALVQTRPPEGSVKTATALSTGWCRRSGPAGSPPPRPVPPHAPDPCVAASRTRHCRCATGRATTWRWVRPVAVEAGGSTHRPASGKATPASFISWVTKVFTRPSPAATRLVVGMAARQRVRAETYRKAPRRGSSSSGRQVRQLQNSRAGLRHIFRRSSRPRVRSQESSNRWLPHESEL